MPEGVLIRREERIESEAALTSREPRADLSDYPLQFLF